MARKLDPKAIKQRIAENKKTMRDTKRVVTDSMNAATKGNDFDASEARAALSDFIKSAQAIQADMTKLESLNDNAE